MQLQRMFWVRWWMLMSVARKLFSSGALPISVCAQTVIVYSLSKSWQRRVHEVESRMGGQR
jgi:hypothetical protein